MSQFNVFVKSNIKTAFAGAYPNYTIDFTKLIVSKGTLKAAGEGETLQLINPLIICNYQGVLLLIL